MFCYVMSEARRRWIMGTETRSESKRLFQEELEALKEAKECLEGGEAAGGIITAGQYGRLVDQYGKLLRNSMKLSRISDIQGRALIEREHDIRVANESLKQMERLRRDVISDISHELGTPMTALQGFLKALLDGIVPLDRQYLQTMYDKVLIMTQLIEDLFELAKLKGNRLSISLRELLVEDVVEPLSRFGEQEAEKKGILLQVQPLQTELFEGATVILQADLIRIEQVMNNLMANAIKFTPPGGSVQVRFLLESPPGEDRWSTARQDGEQVPSAALVVEVEDTGPGIAEEDLPYVFDRSFRGGHAKQEEIEGSGLGLAIAKEIVTNHGGAIGVSSRQGAGSRFFFALPVQMIGNEIGIDKKGESTC
jgi:signal transduction histidine kinase